MNNLSRTLIRAISITLKYLMSEAVITALRPLSWLLRVNDSFGAALICVLITLAYQCLTNYSSSLGEILPHCIHKRLLVRNSFKDQRSRRWWLQAGSANRAD